MAKIVISESQLQEMITKACVETLSEGNFGKNLGNAAGLAKNSLKNLGKKALSGFKKLGGTIKGDWDDFKSTYQNFKNNDFEKYSEEGDSDGGEQQQQSQEDPSAPQPFPDLTNNPIKKAEDDARAAKSGQQQSTDASSRQQNDQQQGDAGSQWTSTTSASYGQNDTDGQNAGNNAQQQNQSWGGYGAGEDSMDESKNVVKLDETKLRKMVAESVKKVLKEMKK